MSVEDKLIRMKQQLEQAKRQADQAQGALDQLMERLKTEFEVDGVEAGQLLLDKLQREASELEQDIEIQVKKLEENYEWA